jgi:hypothetical protein
MKSLWAATLAAAVLLAVTACGSSRHEASFAHWSSVGKLRVPTPAGFHELRSVGQVAITDLPTGYLRQTSLPTGFTYPDGVALIVTEAVFHARPPALKLPLSLDELERGSGGYRPFWGGAFVSKACGSCGVYVWIGPKAPAADRAAVVQALTSIKD